MYIHHMYICIYIYTYACVVCARTRVYVCKSETNIIIIDKVKMLKREHTDVHGH